jgi:hypothetical protein
MSSWSQVSTDHACIFSFLFIQEIKPMIKVAIFGRKLGYSCSNIVHGLGMNPSDATWFVKPAVVSKGTCEAIDANARPIGEWKDADAAVFFYDFKWNPDIIEYVPYKPALFARSLALWEKEGAGSKKVKVLCGIDADRAVLDTSFDKAIHGVYVLGGRVEIYKAVEEARKEVRNRALEVRIRALEARWRVSLPREMSLEAKLEVLEAQAASKESLEARLEVLETQAASKEDKENFGNL